MKPVSFNSGWTYEPGLGGSIFARGENAVAPIAVTLPHDAVIHMSRVPDAPSSTNKGFYPNGPFLYKKTFHVPAEWADKRVSIEFEGVYMNARVYINGDFAGQCPNGYAGFAIPCNDLMLFGEDNLIEVKLHTDMDSRWYSGAGIYRNVKLYVADQVHVARNGVRLTTLAADSEVASIQAEIALVNEGTTRRVVDVSVELIDDCGNVACADVQRIQITSGAKETLNPRLYVKNPKLWDLDAPNLYAAVVKVSENGEVIDETEIETFGIRVLTLDNVRGLAINGKSVKLYGGCIHHDNGILGAATIERAEERRIEKLKSAGYNAIRMAHHPASKALLKACDKHGVAVMDELTDMWNSSKSPRDYGNVIEYRWEEDVRDMVEKDYNHPSVVMYSLGNEILESGKPAGARIYRKLANLVRALDTTRYTTAGLNNMIGAMDIMKKLMEERKKQASGELNSSMAEAGMDIMSEISKMPEVVNSSKESYEAMDIAGYNYATARHAADAENFPNWISVGAETFPKDLAENWRIVKENPAVIGDFVWTAYDYLGEAGIGRDSYKGQRPSSHSNPYPWFIAYDADFDLIGVRTPQGYYREIVVDHRTQPYVAMQTPETYELEPMVGGWSWPGTVSSWNWPGFEGKPIRVEVYGKGDEVELIVNGESVGKKPIPAANAGQEVAYRTVFDCVYAPGKVEAVVYAGGVETGRYAVETACDSVEICAEADRSEIKADDTDLAYIEIALCDAQGRLNPGVSRKVAVTVEGAGVLQGLGSGNPCCEENFFDGAYTTFYGNALAAIRPTGAGEIKVTITADGCKDVCVTVTAK